MVFHSFIEQEPDDYVEVRFKSNVDVALEFDAQSQYLSAGLSGSHWNRSNGFTEVVSQTADKLDIEQLLPPLGNRVLGSRKRKIKTDLEPYCGMGRLCREHN